MTRLITAIREQRGGWRVSLGTLDVLFTRDPARLAEIERAARVVETTVMRQCRDAEAAARSFDPRRLLARADSAAARGHRVFQRYLRASRAREA
jgi:hypothetical protein